MHSVLRRSVAAAAVISLLFAASANANTITVDSTADTTGDTDICTLRDAINSANWNQLTTPPAFGDCADGSHPPDTSPDTINFSLGSGPHTIQLNSQLPSIANDTTITGPGAGLLTVRGELGTEDYPVIPIEDEGTTPFPTVTLEKMTITNGSKGISVGAALGLTLNDAIVNGNTTSDTQTGTSIVGGAGINDTGGANISVNNSTISGNSATATTTGAGVCCSVFTHANGAAINLGQGGNLSINTSTISGNTASASGNQTADAIGGAIFDDFGNVTISRSTISGNSAVATVSEAGGAGSSRASGGALYMQGGSEQLILDRATVSGNSTTATASQGGGTIASGGGLQLVWTAASPPTASATGSTIAGNSVSGAGSGTVQGSNIDLSTGSSGSFSSENTIMAGGSGAANCVQEGDGPFTSGGYNIDSGTTCLGTPATGDQQSTNPNLGPLQNNGGVQGNGDPILTRAPAVGSPAVDQGTDNGIDAGTDQRGTGFARTFDMNPSDADDGTDVGAFEQQIWQDQTNFDFGALKWGTTSSPQSVTLTNYTGNSFTSGATAFGGTNPSDFLISAPGDSCTGFSHSNLATCTTNVAFHPVTAGSGARSAALSLPSNVAPSISVPLSGTATEYISIAPSPHDFGSTQVGTPTGATQFTVTNAGPGTSGTLGAGIGGANPSQFEITEDNCTGQALAASGACTVSVRFLAATAGTMHASLDVTGTPGGTQSSQLTGTATSPTPPPSSGPTGPTGQRAAALKKCKKKKSAQARKKCKKKANRLPV